MKYIFIYDFLTFYFLNVATSVIPTCIAIRFKPHVNVVCMEGTVSQIFNLDPSFYFMT